LPTFVLETFWAVMLIAADGLEADVALYDLLVLSILCESAKKNSRDVNAIRSATSPENIHVRVASVEICVPPCEVFPISFIKSTELTKLTMRK
jgi:hypothetical protein